MLASINWTQLLAPTVAAVLGALVLLLGALLTGIINRAKAWLTAHGDAAAASALASATAVVQPALATGASVIIGKISAGTLDYTDRAAVVAEAGKEASLVALRVPDMVSVLQPVAGSLVADIMGKVDAMHVASPTLPSTPVASGSAPSVAPGYAPVGPIPVMTVSSATGAARAVGLILAAGLTLSLAACGGSTTAASVAAQAPAAVALVSTDITTAQTDLQNAINAYGTAKGLVLVVAPLFPQVATDAAAIEAKLDPIVASAQALLTASGPSVAALESAASQIAVQVAAISALAAPHITATPNTATN